jgi:hypothetical protein
MRKAEDRFASKKIPFWEWVSVNHSFRFMPSCRNRLKRWHTEGTYTFNLNACTRTASDCFEMVDVLTRVLLWCGDWETALEWAETASKRYGIEKGISKQRGHVFPVPQHTFEHLCITKFLARAGSPHFVQAKESWGDAVRTHIGVWDDSSIPDVCQRARVILGYSRVFATYGLSEQSLQFGWRALCVRGVSGFVRLKAVVNFATLPFIWIHSR